MDERDVELIDYLQAIWRQKWVILITVAAAVAAAWGATQAITLTYRTETSLLLLPPLSSQLGTEAIGSRLPPQTYKELAVSTSLLESVKAKAGLESVSTQSLKGQFSVSINPLGDQGEFLLKATIRGSDANQLPAIATAWTEAFTEQFSELFEDRTARSYSYLSQIYAETEAELEALVEERISFLADQPLTSLKAEAEALETMLRSNSKEILRAKQELESVEAYLVAREGNGSPQLPTYVLASEVDPYTLLGAIVFGLSASDYRDLVGVRIADLERSTTTISEKLVTKQREIDAAEAALEEFDRGIALLEKAQANLAAKLQDARIAMAETPEPIRVIDEPYVPHSPIGRHSTTNIAVAGVLGLMLGTLLALFVDYLARMRNQGGSPPAPTRAKPDESDVGTTTLDGADEAADLTDQEEDGPPNAL